MAGCYYGPSLLHCLGSCDHFPSCVGLLFPIPVPVIGEPLNFSIVALQLHGFTFPTVCLLLLLSSFGLAFSCHSGYTGIALPRQAEHFRAFNILPGPDRLCFVTAFPAYTISSFCDKALFHFTDICHASVTFFFLLCLLPHLPPKWHGNPVPYSHPSTHCIFWTNDSVLFCVL